MSYVFLSNTIDISKACYFLPGLSFAKTMSSCTGAIPSESIFRNRQLSQFRFIDRFSTVHTWGNTYVHTYNTHIIPEKTSAWFPCGSQVKDPLRASSFTKHLRLLCGSVRVNRHIHTYIHTYIDTYIHHTLEVLKY